MAVIFSSTFDSGTSPDFTGWSGPHNAVHRGCARSWAFGCGGNPSQLVHTLASSLTTGTYRWEQGSKLDGSAGTTLVGPALLITGGPDAGFQVQSYLYGDGTIELRVNLNSIFGTPHPDPSGSITITTGLGPFRLSYGGNDGGWATAFFRTAPGVIPAGGQWTGWQLAVTITSTQTISLQIDDVTVLSGVFPTTNLTGGQYFNRLTASSYSHFPQYATAMDNVQLDDTASFVSYTGAACNAPLLTTCTAAYGAIVVTKTTDRPADDELFAFIAEGGLTPLGFTLAKDGSYTFTLVPSGSGYVLREAPRGGWLSSGTVSNDSPLTNITVADGETVNVTFANRHTTPIRFMRIFPHIDDKNMRLFISRLEVEMQRGVGLSTGQGSDPQVMLSISRDGGMTYGPEDWLSAGTIGDYRKRVYATRLGSARDFVFKLVVTDPVFLALAACTVDLTEGRS